METNKDNRIEFYRFVFAVIIMIFHAHNINNGQGHPIPLGHVFVEFFFFLTGYYTYLSLKKRYGDDIDISMFPFKYTWRKFKRFVPYTLMTAVFYIVVIFFFELYVNRNSLRAMLLEFSGVPFDVLLLQVTGICKNPSFNAWWYLSANLFTMPLVILIFYKKICSGGVYTYITYFIPLLIYGAFAVEVNGLDWDREVFEVIKSGLFRGFAGLCMGSVIYDAKCKLGSLKIKVPQRIVLTFIEIVSFVFSVLIAWKWSNVDNGTFLIVLLVIIGLIVALSNKSYTYCFDKKVFAYLGSFSLPLYICHYSIGRLIGRYYKNEVICKRYFLYFVCSFSFSLCMLVLVRLHRREHPSE